MNHFGKPHTSSGNRMGRIWSIFHISSKWNLKLLTRYQWSRKIYKSKEASKRRVHCSKLVHHYLWWCRALRRHYYWGQCPESEFTRNLSNSKIPKPRSSLMACAVFGCLPIELGSTPKKSTLCYYRFNPFLCFEFSYQKLCFPSKKKKKGNLTFTFCGKIASCKFTALLLWKGKCDEKLGSVMM